EGMFKDKNIMSMRLNLTTDVIEHASQQYQPILKGNYSYDNFISNVISSSIPEETQRERFIETFARENLLNSYNAGGGGGVSSLIQCEYQRFMPDGTLKWVTTVIKILTKPYTNEVIAFTTTADTDMEHISKELLENVASHDYDYVIYLDAKNNSYRMFASDSKNTPLPPQICYDYESALKVHAYKYVIPEDIEYTIQCMLLKNLFEQLEKNDVYEFTVSSVEKDGSVRMKKVKYSYLDKKNKIMILSRTDVTDLYHQLQEYNKLRELANRDSLTGLYNKNYFYANLAREVGTPDAKWIFFIDLDDFKRVNDKLGHLMGDRIIRGVANILRGIFGEEAVVGRFGGDEFFVLLKNVSERIVRERAEEICSSLCFRYDNNAKRVEVHASVGVFMFSEKMEVEEVMHCADEALYHAKAEGKSKYVLYHEITNHVPIGNAPRLSRGQ
ncbi:MAG: GGDEF domain-containing protein, partial [Cloacibacillus sp.]